MTLILISYFESTQISVLFLVGNQECFKHLLRFVNHHSEDKRPPPTGLAGVLHTYTPAILAHLCTKYNIVDLLKAPIRILTFVIVDVLMSWEQKDFRICGKL